MDENPYEAPQPGAAEAKRRFTDYADGAVLIAAFVLVTVVPLLFSVVFGWHLF
jgi:hypothetical protein